MAEEWERRSYFGYFSKWKWIGFGYGWLGKRRDFRISSLDSIGRIEDIDSINHNGKGGNI